MFNLTIGATGFITHDFAPSLSRRIQMEQSRKVKGHPRIKCGFDDCDVFANDEAKQLKRCGQCKLTFYCCSDHQIKDWAQHKTVCKQVKLVVEYGQKCNYACEEKSVPQISEEVRQQSASIDDENEEVLSNGIHTEELSACASDHLNSVSALTTGDLEKTYELPCCRLFGGFTRPQENSQINIAPMSKLLQHDFQCTICQTDDPCFYSFCLDKVCTEGTIPGAVTHCPLCNQCRDYMCWHCDTCNQCTYGQNLPCMHCHHMVLYKDGLHFLTKTKGSCDANKFLGCQCAQGESPWNGCV